MQTFPTEHALPVQRGSELVKANRSDASGTIDRVYLEEHKALCAAGIYPARRRFLRLLVLPTGVVYDICRVTPQVGIGRKPCQLWRARLGSNQQPLPSEGSTLSIELRALRLNTKAPRPGGRSAERDREDTRFHATRPPHAPARLLPRQVSPPEKRLFPPQLRVNAAGSIPARVWPPRKPSVYNRRV